MKIKFTNSENERFNRESSMSRRQKLMSLYQFLLKATSKNGELFNSLTLSLNQLLDMLTEGGKKKTISRAALHARIKKLEKLGLLEISGGKGQESSIYKFTRVKLEEKKIIEPELTAIENSFETEEEFFGTYDSEEINFYSNICNQDKKQDSLSTDNRANENNFNEGQLNNIILNNKIKTLSYTSNEVENHSESKDFDYENYINNSLDKVRDFKIIEKHLEKAIKIIRIRKTSRAYEEVLENLRNNYFNITVKYAFNYVLKAVKAVKVKYQIAREDYAQMLASAKRFKKMTTNRNTYVANFDQRDVNYDELYNAGELGI